MNFIGSVKKALSQNGKIYFTGLVLLLGIKFYYTKAGSDELLWILAPTARWVYMLSGITFEYVSPIGYVNHSFQFILAPSCSGVRFLVICAAMLLFSFTHWMKTDKSRFCWLGAAFCLSYVFTILVNGFRILLSIRLPLFLHKAGIRGTLGQWSHPKTLHTLIGTTVYFISLLALYLLAEAVLKRVTKRCAKMPLGWLLPAFWYVGVLLGIPLLHRAYEDNIQGFMGYAALILLVCLPITGLVRLVQHCFHLL